MWRLAKELMAEKTKVAAKLEVMLSLSKRGETSAMSNKTTLPDLKIVLKYLRILSGCSPSGCVALTPGANADENTSVQMVM